MRVASTEVKQFAYVPASTPAEAAMLHVVRAGCVCDGLLAVTRDHPDHWRVTFHHTDEGCPLGPVTFTAVGRPVTDKVNPN